MALSTYKKVFPRVRWDQDISWVEQTLPTTDTISKAAIPKNHPVIYGLTYPRSQHENMGWVNTVINNQIIPYEPIWQAQANTFVTPKGRVLDLTQRWDQDASWIQHFLNPSVGVDESQYGPPTYQLQGSYRTPQAPQLDVRLGQWEKRHFGIPFDPALWVDYFGGSYNHTTPKGKSLDVRSGQWVQDTSYITQINQVTQAQINPGIQQITQSFRTPERKGLPPQYQTWDTGYAYQALQGMAPIPSWGPAFTQLQGSYRTPPGVTMKPQYYQWGTGDAGWMWWIVTNPPPPPTNVVVNMFDCGSMTSYLT